MREARTAARTHDDLLDALLRALDETEWPDLTRTPLLHALCVCARAERSTRVELEAAVTELTVATPVVSPRDAYPSLCLVLRSDVSSSVVFDLVEIALRAAPQSLAIHRRLSDGLAALSRIEERDASSDPDRLDRAIEWMQRSIASLADAGPMGLRAIEARQAELVRLTGMRRRG
jgi:hypothetical protein